MLVRALKKEFLTKFFQKILFVTKKRHPENLKYLALCGAWWFVMQNKSGSG
jgi:hypothetical protein